MRETTINLRPQPQQRDLIDRAAQLLGKSRADFMLEAAYDKAQAVLLDQVFFNLDDADFRQFSALLESPAQGKPDANPGLDRLRAVDLPWSARR